MRILGVDPGLNGGLAILARDGDSTPIRLLEVIDTPTEGDDHQREVSPLVLTFIQKWRPDVAYMERAQAFPNQGASSGFIYGMAYGALRIAIRGCLVPLTRIESRAWKRGLDLPVRTQEEYRQAKEDARLKALALFPETPGYFQRVMDHNRAEASLIAYYGMMLAGSRPAAMPTEPVRRRRRAAPRGPGLSAAETIRQAQAEVERRAEANRVMARLDDRASEQLSASGD